MRTAKISFLMAVTIIVILAGCAKEQNLEIIPGADRTDMYLEDLRGKNVAMAINNTSTIDGVSSLDTLLSLGINIVKVFGPEHGIRGGNVYDSVDAKTGVPIKSLYRSGTFKPLPQDMEDVEIMIFDMQDVGTRFYTYLSTLHYIMEACAEHNVPLIVLDRPNPNDFYVDGPIHDPAFKSFVGMHPIPIVHGLTFGEFANMINKEGWLANGIQCDVKIVEILNYEHGKPYILPIPPSPNLNTQQSILLYPSLCLFEGTVISQGRGTMFPFQVLGNPLLGENYQFSFTPVSIEGMSTNPPHKDKECFGLDLREYDTNIFKETGRLNLNWLIEFYNVYPNKDEFFHTARFDRLAGTDILRNQIIEGKSEQEIRESWEPALSQYKETRKRYLLYTDFQ